VITKQNILSILRSVKPELEKKYPLKTLALFGSYSRNENLAGSDIVILKGTEI